MTPDEAWAFSQGCCVWKNYKSIDAYIEDIVTILVYSPWHYSEEEARKTCPGISYDVKYSWFD